MDALRSPSRHINVNCCKNNNDDGTQNIIGMMINYNSAQPSMTSQKQVPFPSPGIIWEKVKENIEKVLKWLQDPKSHSIGVWGMGGVGKTTLLEFIYNELLSCVCTAQSTYWVKVSQNCTLTNLQDKIAQIIGLDLKSEGSEERRAALLYDKLREMKRVVLILDDVWDRFMLDEIKIPREEDGCKIILSTRKLEMCRSMSCGDFVVQVPPLTLSEALQLFILNLESYEELTEEVKLIANSVAGKCYCLPLAIKTIASSLKGEHDIYEWQKALYELDDIDSLYTYMDEGVLKMLKISYDRLKNEQLKNCFLLCALFPEEYEINRQHLVHLLMMEEERVHYFKGMSLLNELENSCLLERWTRPWDRADCVKMHDLVREMALMILKKDPRFMARAGLGLEEVPDEKHWTKDLVKASLSINNIKEIPCDMSPEAPNLTVLLLNENKYLCGIPESFFVHMKSLKVLDLSHTDIDRLPESFCDLEDLRMLLLVGCRKLRYVPSLAKLLKLRRLFLPSRCYDWNWGLEEVPRGLEGLKCLEMLEYCQWKASDVIHYNSFIELAQLSLISYSLAIVDGDLEPFSAIKILQIQVSRSTIEGTHRDCMYERVFYITGGKYGDDIPIPIIPWTTDFLSLENVEITSGNKPVGVLFPLLGHFKELRLLNVKNCQGLRYIERPPQDSSSCQIDTVEILFLKSLFDLERIINHGAYCFSCLTRLSIVDCPRLEAGLPIGSAHNSHPLLPHLRIIEVARCQVMKEVFETSGLSSGFSSSCVTQVHNFDPTVILFELEELYLNDLPMLDTICRGMIVCRSLKTRHISKCPRLNLASVPPAIPEVEMGGGDGRQLPPPARKKIKLLP